jgi:hypothetical protein
LIDEDLMKMNNWAEKWKIKFSPPKTEEVVISKKRKLTAHPPATLAGQQVKRVPTHKHLGICIAQDLNWKDHIEQITDKANRRLGILRSLKYKLDRLSLEKIYMGLIRPLLEYGDIVWQTPGQILEPLERVQLNAARIITGATARSSSEGLYKETCWETLNDRRDSHRLVQFYKIMNNKAPQYLTDMTPKQVGNRTNYMLRNRGELDLPVTRINCLANSFFPAATRLWNETSLEMKNLPSVSAFKAAHARLRTKPNPLVYYGGRLEACMQARMRIRNSPLKDHLANELHVIDNPLCDCGSGAIENVDHFFFECAIYEPQRRELNNSLLPFVINNSDYLLNGVPNQDHLDNIHIFSAVHKYIRDTKRFY